MKKGTPIFMQGRECGNRRKEVRKVETLNGMQFQAKFELCPSEKCTATNYESTLTLETRHIGKGCDRDTYDLASQERLSVEFLYLL